MQTEKKWWEQNHDKEFKKDRGRKSDARIKLSQKENKQPKEKNWA